MHWDHYRKPKTKCRGMEPRLDGYTHKTLLHLRLNQHFEKESRKTVKRQNIFEFDILLFLFAISRSYDHKLPSVGLSMLNMWTVQRCEKNKDDIKEHTKLNWEHPMSLQPYTKNYKQMKKSGNRRGGLIQGITCQLFLHCQIVNSRNIHTCSIIPI